MQDLMHAQLARWGICEDAAARAGIYSVLDAATIHPSFRRLPALVIPYFSPAKKLVTYELGSVQMPFCRVRYLADSPPTGGFTQKKPLRYSQPPHSGAQVYWPPTEDWVRIIADSREPILITEGEAKALTACIVGFPTVGLGGVSNFTNHNDGLLLPALRQVQWRGREVYIVFDSDAASNPAVRMAEARLVEALQRQLGARCRIVRFLQSGEEKIGLDDFLIREGSKGLTELLCAASDLSGLDVKVIALNSSVAWIESEGQVYDTELKQFMQKDNFVTGSRFSSQIHIGAPTGQRSKETHTSVARAWLTHPHAQRYADVLFRPGEGAAVDVANGHQALNLWEGFVDEPGDATPFLQLTQFLLKDSRDDMREFPVKLMAYKAQNPQRKVPIALMLVGEKGTGKSMWCKTIMMAFDPYSAPVNSSSFAGDFQGWLEKTLIVFVDEVEPKDLQKGSEILKKLISAEQMPMNEKYRKARTVNNYTQFLFSTNKVEAAAFDFDDRRMCVIGAPHKNDRLDSAFYADYERWLGGGGAKAVMHYLLEYPLRGWEPPPEPPLSAEKVVAYLESLTPVQRLAEDMRTADENIVKLWMDAAMEWAHSYETSGNEHLAKIGRATREHVPRMTVRAFYTAAELADMFPSVVAQMQNVKYSATTTTGQLSRQLRDVGVPYLPSRDDPRGFRVKGKMEQYLVVNRFEDWHTPLSQAEFERLITQAPRYAEYMRKRK